MKAERPYNLNLPTPVLHPNKNANTHLQSCLDVFLCLGGRRGNVVHDLEKGVRPNAQRHFQLVCGELDPAVDLRVAD